MALELETKIMEEIGLGMHYNWWNGSGSCKWARQEAVKNLPNAIKKYHDLDPQQIALPDADLITVLTRVADIGDRSDYTLTKTWQAASYVIAEHIHQAKATQSERKEAYKRLQEDIEREYLPFPPSRATYERILY